MNICQYCKTEYEAKRTTSKYCSDACRKLAFKQVSVADSVPEISVASEKEVSVPDANEDGKFVNHITGEEHKVTDVSKRTGLNYDLEEVSEKAKFTKHRCIGCGEPTWFGCAECGKNGGVHKEV